MFKSELSPANKWPQQDPNKVLNIGVAAHITAASKGGVRYDSSMGRQERVFETNGIWLCQPCAKLVDNDEDRYSVNYLRTWKRLSEEAALLDLEVPGGHVGGRSQNYAAGSNPFISRTKRFTSS